MSLSAWLRAALLVASVGAACSAVQAAGGCCRYAVDDMLHSSVLSDCWPVVAPSYACDAGGGACQDVGTPVRYGGSHVYYCPWHRTPLPLGCASLCAEPRRSQTYSGALAMGPLAERPDRARSLAYGS